MCRRSPLDRIAGDACVVASELVTNAVTYARTPIGLTLRTTGDALRIEVTDESSAPPAMARSSADALGGRGLLMVDQLATTWGSERRGHGKVVWAVIDCNP